MANNNISESMHLLREKIEAPGEFRSPLVPGDVRSLWQKTQHLSLDLPVGDDTKRVEYLIFVAAQYSVPGDPVRRVTERLYTVNEGKADDPLGHIGLASPIPPDLKLEDVAIHPGGHVRVT